MWLVIQINNRGGMNLANKDDLGRSSAKNDDDLKGTFVSVFIIGGIILLFWITMFGIYIERL